MARSLKLCTLLKPISFCGQTATYCKSSAISNIHHASATSKQQHGRDIQVYKQWHVDGATWSIEDLNIEEYPAIEPLIMRLFKEPNFSVLLGIDKDENALIEINKYWRESIKDGVSLVCCRTCLGKKEYAGVNLSPLMSIERPPIKFNEIETEGCRMMFGILDHIYTLFDAYELLNVNKYLGFGALYVAPQYRHQRISTNIFECRKLMCRRFGIPASVGLFASVKAEKAAASVGFKPLLEVSIADLAKAGFNFPEGLTGRLTVMAKVYDDV